MISLLIGLIIIAFIVWLIQTAPFLNGWLKSVILGVIGIFVLILVLNLFGVISYHLPLN